MSVATETDHSVITDEELEEAIEGNFPCHAAPSILVLRRWWLLLSKCKRPAMWIVKLSCCGSRYYICDVHKKSVRRLNCTCCNTIVGQDQVTYRPLG